MVEQLLLNLKIDLVIHGVLEFLDAWTLLNPFFYEDAMIILDIGLVLI